MAPSEIKLLRNLRFLSRYCILAGILISAAFSLVGGMPIPWQIGLALIALAIGIPHGAVDHLISVPNSTFSKMTLFIMGYLAVTAVAIWAILASPQIGFQAVVIMSAIHFGLGDASFVAELESRTPAESPAIENASKGRFPKVAYVIAAGFTPVLIPLVSEQSTLALAAVNPRLIDWSRGFAPALFVTSIAIATLAILWMLLRRRPQEAIDLSLLLALAVIAPPLVAFAFYFGLWHALRHTGRLSLEYEKSTIAHAAGKSWKAFGAAVWAGAPALVIVLGFTIFLGVGMGFNLEKQFLWFLLVVIWALTVPHMILTLRLDLRALRRE